MITYVDTSCLLKLVVDEDGSDRAELIWDIASLVDGLTIVEVTEERIADASELAEDEALRASDAVPVAAALTVEATALTSAQDPPRRCPTGADFT